MSERHGKRPPGRAASSTVRDPARRRRLWSEWGLLAGVVAVVFAGGGLWLAGLRGAADVSWIVATCAGLVPGVVWVVRSLLRRQVGVDVIAVLALVGALVVREYLAGAVVAVMLATGRSLEAYAERRAARDLHALLEREPRSARRRTAQGPADRHPRVRRVRDHRGRWQSHTARFEAVHGPLRHRPRAMCGFGPIEPHT